MSPQWGTTDHEEPSLSGGQEDITPPEHDTEKPDDSTFPETEKDEHDAAHPAEGEDCPPFPPAPIAAGRVRAFKEADGFLRFKGPHLQHGLLHPSEQEKNDLADDWRDKPHRRSHLQSLYEDRLRAWYDHSNLADFAKLIVQMEAEQKAKAKADLANAKAEQNAKAVKERAEFRTQQSIKAQRLAAIEALTVDDLKAALAKAPESVSAPPWLALGNWDSRSAEDKEKIELKWLAKVKSSLRNDLYKGFPESVLFAINVTKEAA